MAEVVWTERAVADLDAIASYIALDKPDAASALVERVRHRVGLLGQYPLGGPRVPELLPDARFRQAVEPPCRIFYRYDSASERVIVLAVRRGEMLFQKALLRRRDREAQG